jgi:DNA-binding response OmpR family regulator
MSAKETKMKALKRPHVLYVDDDEDSCELMTVLLGMSQIDVTCAHGIENVLLLPDKHQFDVFVLDLWLHDGDGNYLCIKLREEFPSIPVVFYTGGATEREKKQGLLSGAAAYLVKPHSDLVAPTILRLLEEKPSVIGKDAVDRLKQNALNLVNITHRTDRELPLFP